MKQKMDAKTKTKLIYSVELIVIAVAFLVLAILEFTGVLKVSVMQARIFTWVTLFGGILITADFFWTLLSKNRRKRSSLLDKSLALPLALFVFVLAIISLVKDFNFSFNLHGYVIPSVFCYVFVIYTFEGIYHWYHPLEYLFEEEEEEKPTEQPADNKNEPIENKEEKVEDNKENEKE